MQRFGVLVMVILIGILLLGVVALVWTDIIGFFMVIPVTTTTEYEHLDTGDDNTTFYLTVGTDNLALQTFTAASTHSVNQIKVKVWRTGSGVGSLTLDLYAADVTGDPTGVALSTGTINVVALTNSPIWMTVTMTTTTTVTVAQDYDIVASYAGADAIVWRLNSATPPQSHFAYSTDAGATWNR